MIGPAGRARAPVDKCSFPVLLYIAHAQYCAFLLQRWSTRFFMINLKSRLTDWLYLVRETGRLVIAKKQSQCCFADEEGHST